MFNGALTVYNSKGDMYGNCYFAVELDTGASAPLVHGHIGTCSNVNTRDCRENLHWHIAEVELPIRQFNRLTKDWPYAGCGWPEISAFLRKGAT